MYLRIFRAFSNWSHVYSNWLTALVTGFLVIIFLVLAFKHPYSDRSLVGNLEPYPDTLYYSTPAWNLAHGDGFEMRYKNYTVKQEMPPIYSLYLVPFFAIFDDVRSFYFANIILGVLTLILFIKSWRTIFSGVYSIVLVTFLGFLYVTNYYVYTLPSYMMAENISLFLLSLGVYLLVSKVSKYKVIIIPIITLLLILSKLSNLPIAIVIYLSALMLLIFKKDHRILMSFFNSSLICGLIALMYFIKSGFLVGHKNFEDGATFSFNYFAGGFRFYSKTLLGNETLFLWFRERLVHGILVPFAGLGLLIGSIQNKYRFISVFTALSIGALLSFMSMFPVHDARYIMVLLPLFLTAVGVCFHGISPFRYSRLIVGFAMVVIILVGMLTPYGGYRNGELGIMTLKRQLGINFRHRETPWNYKAVEHFNKYFNLIDKNNIVLATFLPVYYINFFENDKYDLAPLSMSQEFFWYKNGLNKQMKISSIETYLKMKIKDGNRVYVTNAYVGNVAGWSGELEQIKKKFNARLVSRGCLDTCNIYKLSK